MRQHQGTEIKTTGDGFLAAFEGPSRAIHCATAIQNQMAEIGLAVRVSVHTGECERRGEDLSGIAVHLASRLLERAQPGEVLVSRTVKDLVVGSGIAFEDRGEAGNERCPRHLAALRRPGNGPLGANRGKPARDSSGSRRNASTFGGGRQIPNRPAFNM